MRQRGTQLLLALSLSVIVVLVKMVIGSEAGSNQSGPIKKAGQAPAPYTNNFIGGSHLPLWSRLLAFSVYHRFVRLQDLNWQVLNSYDRLPLRGDQGPASHDQYYSRYYSRSECEDGCHPSSHCLWGTCTCRQGLRPKAGRCWEAEEFLDAWGYNRKYENEPSCRDSSDCWQVDINMVCRRLRAVGGIGRGFCQCRQDMKWNFEFRECQLHLPVACPLEPSSNTTDQGDPKDQQVSEKRHELEKALKIVKNNRTETPEESLTSSGLLGLGGRDQKQLESVYCSEERAFRRIIEESVGGDEGRPSSCPKLPLSLRQLTPPDQRVAALQASSPQPCAMLFDSTSCTGGWKLELPDGKTKTFTGLFLSANWFMRDDLDTVGVKAGCSLHLWTRLDFDGAYTVVTAGFKDRWIILQEQEEFRRFHENVESVACSCGRVTAFLWKSINSPEMACLEDFPAWSDQRFAFQLSSD